MPTGSESMHRGWCRLMMFATISSTGFCEMALQIIIIFIFQNVFGYIYERIGLITALYMCGLAFGAGSAARMTLPRRLWPGMIGLELIIICVALAAPFCMTHFPRIATAGVAAAGVEVAIYVLIVVTGWAGGAQFSLANHILSGQRGRAGSTAATTNAADLVGSAAGGFIAGVLLLPLLGVAPVCLMLAALKGSSVLGIFSALLARAEPRH